MYVSSCLPISLLPTISRKAYTQKINKELNPQDWIPDHQFGFRQSHSTVQQYHHIKDAINKLMENQQYCTAPLLDVSQAFDKVWHPGLLLKIKRILLSSYFNQLKSYLNESQFETKFNGETSSRFHTNSVTPKGSIFGPLHSSLCTTYLLTPWCRVLLEKLAGLQLVKKFPAFYGIRKFITAFTSFCHPSLSWASPIQSTCPQPTSWRSILILILRRSRTGTVWFYTSTSNKTAARTKLYTKSLTRGLKLMYSRLTLVRISINL